MAEESSNKKTWLVVVIALAALGGGAFLILRSTNPSVGVDAWPKVWCFDLATGKTFVGSETQVPPFDIEASKLEDGSPAGVRAEMYACGSCDDPSKQFVGYLWKFNPDLHDRVAAVVAANPKGVTDISPYMDLDRFGVPGGKLIASREKSTEWFAQTAPEAQRIITGAEARCAAKDATVCPAK